MVLHKFTRETISKFEKPTQKPIQKNALKNSRSTIHKIFILIKAKSNLNRKQSTSIHKKSHDILLNNKKGGDVYLQRTGLNLY